LVVHFADIAGYIKDNLHSGDLKEELPLDVAAELEYLVEKETALFKSNLAVSVFTHNGVEPIPEYISYCLAQLVSVCDQLSVFLERRGGDFNAGAERHSPEINMIRDALAGLMDLFQFIVEEYAVYLKKDFKLPKSYIGYFYPILKMDANEILLALENRKANAELLEMLKLYFNNCFCPGTGSVTKHEMDYLRFFVSQVYAFVKAPGTGSFTAGLTHLLFDLNFNCFSFITYYQQELFKKMRAQKSVYNKLNFIADTLRGLKSGNLLTDEGCNLKFNSTRSYFINLLNEEFQTSLMLMFAEKQVQVKGKLPLNLAVPQIGLLVQAFDAVGMYGCSADEVFKFISRNCTSKRQSILSYKSMSNKSYAVDQNTAKMIKQLLLKMIAFIDRKFFPVIVSVVLSAYTV